MRALKAHVGESAGRYAPAHFDRVNKNHKADQWIEGLNVRAIAAKGWLQAFETANSILWQLGGQLLTLLSVTLQIHRNLLASSVPRKAPLKNHCFCRFL